MLQQILITLGAGVASAVFFLLPLKGGLLASFFVLIAALPLLIVGLGFGARAAAMACASGAALIAYALAGSVAVGYLLSVVTPAMGVALLVQRAAKAGRGVSLPHLLATLVALTTAIDWLALVMVGWAYPSFAAALDGVANQLLPLVTVLLDRTNLAPASISAEEIARMMVMLAGPMMAVWGVLSLAFNVWLAGRIVQVSGRLSQPWPDIPAGLGLPRSAGPVLASAVALMFAPDAVRLFAVTFAAAIAAALALQGLAILHYLSRGVGARVGVLGGLYAATLLMFPWPLVFAAGLGLAEFLVPLRRKRGLDTRNTPTPNPPNPTQGD